MTVHHPTRRRALRRAAAAGSLLCAVVMSVSAVELIAPAAAAAAAVDAGAAQIVTPSGGAGAGQPLSTGGSATSFSLKLPAGAACAADGNNGGRWHTYMVPATENPAAASFAANGSLVGSSVGSGGAGTFRNSMYSTTGIPVRGQAPNLGDAAIINIPNMNFGVWTAGQIPPGVYNLGIACVDLDLASARDSYWNTQLSIEADATDPIGIAWVVEEPAPTTTSSTTTSTTTASSTSSTIATTSTTTTTTSSTSTTGDIASSSTSTSDPSTAVLGGSFGDSSTGGGGASLPATGGPVARFLASAFLLLVLGRMAVLLARPTPVLGPDR